MIAPYLVEQLHAGMDALGVGHEEMQQAELGRPQVQAHAVAADPVRGRIQPQTPDLDHVVRHLRRAPAQHRLDARQQFSRRERLGDIVVCSRLQAHDLVLLGRFGGEHDDGDTAGARAAAQLARDRQTRLPRQHPVEQHQIGQGLSYDGQRLLCIGSAQRVVAGALQVDGNQFLDGGFVFYD